VLAHDGLPEGAPEGGRGLTAHRSLIFRYAQAIEWGYDEYDEPVVPGGRELTEKIAASLAAGGCRTSVVEQHEDYGWSFTARLDDHDYHHVLNAPDENEVSLSVGMPGYWLKTLLLRKPRPAFERYCERLRTALAALDGVGELRWFEPIR
jgi:hypothetical protein